LLDPDAPPIPEEPPDDDLAPIFDDPFVLLAQPARETESEDEMIARVMEESLAEAQAAGAPHEPPRSVKLTNHTVTREEVRAALQCPICLCEFELHESAVVGLKCEHLFHKGCLDPWFAGRHTCPVCRMDIDEG
jgi:hypothetical protein